MPPITLTRGLAQAASWDAANRAMRAGGRKAWDEDDAIVAAHEFNRLWPTCCHHIEPEDCCPTCDEDPTVNRFRAVRPRQSI